MDIKSFFTKPKGEPSVSGGGCKAAAKYGPKIIDEKGLFDMISTSIALSERVRVVGLIRASNHNDKTGIITAINQDTGRIRVKLDGGNMEIDVKPCNISNPCDSNQRVSENQTQASQRRTDGNNVIRRIVTLDSDDDYDEMPLSRSGGPFKRKRVAVLAAALNHDLPTEGNSWKIMTTHVLKTICKEKQPSQHYNASDTYKPTEQEAIELLDFALKNISDISCVRVDEVLRNCGHFEIPDHDQDDVDNTKIVFSHETKIKEWVVANCKITELYSDAQIVQEYEKIKDREKEQLRINTEIQNKEDEIAALKRKLAQL